MDVQLPSGARNGLRFHLHAYYVAMKSLARLGCTQHIVVISSKILCLCAAWLIFLIFVEFHNKGSMGWGLNYIWASTQENRFSEVC